MRRTAWLQAGLVVGVLVLLFGILTVFNALYIVPARENRFDLYPRWRGGQAMWSGESPYSQAITNAIQQGMFGGTLPPDADQQRMVYPAYIGLILAPLLALPFSTAIAIWLSIQLIAVLATPILWLQILRWKPHPLLLGALILGLGIVFRYPINLYIVGQFTGTILLGFSLALWLLLQPQKRWHAVAGVVLALTAVPPTIAGPLALLLLAGAVLLGRPRGLIAFVGVLAALTAITIAMIGWWIPDWLMQLGDYPGYAAPVWAPNLITSGVLRVLFVAGTVGVLIMAVWRLWKIRDLVEFSLTILILCLLLLPQTGNYYLVLLLPPLLAIFMRGGMIIRLLVAGAIVSPWLLRALPTVSAETLLLPLYVLVLWLWTLARTRPTAQVR